MLFKTLKVKYLVADLRKGSFQDFLQNKAKSVQNFRFVLSLGSNIAVFFIFLYQKTYPKISAKFMIRTPDPLLVSIK